MEELDFNYQNGRRHQKTANSQRLKFSTKGSDNAEDLGLFHKNENQLNLDKIDPTNIGTKNQPKQKSLKLFLNSQTYTMQKLHYILTE
jgi:hypothetical protein